MNNTEEIMRVIAPIITYCVMAIIIIAPIAIFFSLRAIIAVHMNKIALMKGHKKVHAFALCFWLGIPGYIYVVALPDLIQRQQFETIINIVNTKKLES